jgi:hypothetical protein
VKYLSKGNETLDGPEKECNLMSKAFVFRRNEFNLRRKKREYKLSIDRLKPGIGNDLKQHVRRLFSLMACPGHVSQSIENRLFDNALSSFLAHNDQICSSRPLQVPKPFFPERQGDCLRKSYNLIVHWMVKFRGFAGSGIS